MNENDKTAPANQILQAKAEPKPARKFSLNEKRLLLAALLIAVLFERFFVAFSMLGSGNAELWYGVFWLSYLVILYAFYWKKLKRNRIAWYIAACAALLCAWNILVSSGNIDFFVLNIAVIPAVLMVHAQFAAGSYPLKDARAIASAWVEGWFIRPFSGLPVLAGLFKSFAVFKRKMSAESLAKVKKVAIGVSITLPLLLIIVPLLGSADKAFGYYLEDIFLWFIDARFDGGLVRSIIIVLVFFALFYSFLWNFGFGKYEHRVENSRLQIDSIISGIVLGTVVLLYLMFCAFQFTYLFAGEGLPGNLTYSEYAREGFWQTVTVCGINLFMFGIFLWYGKKSKTAGVLLALLLALTGIMLVSGSVRLYLYVNAYGLTWLRVLSAWFVIYLIVVVFVCAVRMLREKTPAIALCMLILLGWYVVLGFSNPNMMIEKYNDYHNHVSYESVR